MKLRDILFPLDFTCDICGIETFDGNICKDCLKSITFNNKITCPVCGRKTFADAICLECKADAPEFARAVSPLVYEGGALKLIGKFKNGKAYLKEFFADLITEKLKEPERADCIVSVPSTKKSIKKRGYDQVKMLAESLSARTGIPYIEGALEKQRETSAQKGLSREDREKNVLRCFRVAKKEEIKDKIVLVIDDVLTTGATANEACRVIKKAGAKAVYFASVASVEYRVHKNSDVR